MSLNSRFIEYCNKKKIRQIDLVNKGYGSVATINKIFKGKQDPNPRLLELFLKDNIDCPARWMLTGEESTTKVEDTRAEYGFCKECIKKEGVIEHLKKEITVKDKRILDLEIKIASLKGRAESQAGKNSKAS